MIVDFTTIVETGCFPSYYLIIMYILFKVDDLMSKFNLFIIFRYSRNGQLVNFTAPSVRRKLEHLIFFKESPVFVESLSFQ